MNINGTIITTPYDTYPEYDPDWRNRVAKAWSGANGRIIVPTTISNDPWIVSHKAFYESNNTIDSVKSPKHWMHVLVQGWHDCGVTNSLKLCLEPLLLTEAVFSTIAADLLGDKYGADGVELIQLYERLFYDCRNPDGTKTDDNFRRRWLAYPSDLRVGQHTPAGQQFKISAYMGGYPGLVLAMMLSDCHGIKPTLEFQMNMMTTCLNSILVRRTAIDSVGNMDLIMAQRNLIEFYKTQKEEDTNDAKTKQVYMTLMCVLKQFMPKVYDEEIPAEHKEMMDIEYKTKLKSQHQVEAHISGVTDGNYLPSLGLVKDQVFSGIDKAVGKLKDAQAEPVK